MDINIYVAITQFAVLLFSLSVHESAHALTSDILGDPTARRLGRISLNPIRHADLFGTVLFPLIGLYSGFMFGWAKPVPVNLGRLRRPVRDHMLVAAAGPASNVVMAALFFACLMIMKASSPEAALIVRRVAAGNFFVDGNALAVTLILFAFWGIIINVILAVFNMLPVAPLDGAAVASGLMPPWLARPFAQLQSHGLMLLIALVFLGVPAYFYMPVISFVLSFLIPI